MKRPALLSLCLLALATPALAGTVPGRQGHRVEAAVSLSSAYLWRGDAVCGFHAAPDVRFIVGNFTLEHYDFLALDGSYKEIDWDLSYRVGDFSFHIADYYYHFSDSPVKENYFSWKKGHTTHIDEVALVYESSALPLTAKWFTFFWGDWLPGSFGRPGALSLSSYLEVAAYHRFSNDGVFTVSLGSSVFKGSYTGYTRDFAPIHAELKYARELSAGKARFPLSASFVLNPYSGQCFAAASAGVSF